jgi:hypothetical protein
VASLKQRNEILHAKKGRDKMLCELDKLIENHAFELKNCKKHLASLNKPDYEDLIEKGDLETKSGE